MDSSQYHANGMSNGSTYSSLPNISPHQLSNSAPHTLPPLQPLQHSMMYSNGTHTPRTPATPNTPGSATNMNFSQQMGGQQQRNYSPQMPMNSYQQQPSYRAPTSSGVSIPQAIAPAPPQNRMQHALAPMPVNGFQSAMHSAYGASNMLTQGMMEDAPTHVVGSQGRRGILPSAPGKPPVPQGSGAAKNTMIPAKDADGKFPCPHCTKTYLHAKHLKRHLLRHTGDRPYMCVLCRDTFSRSDILKRHFQKCSIRRGNPTGASHLSHAQAHLKKSHPGAHKGTSSMGGNGMMSMNGMNMADPALQPFGVIADGSVPDANSNLTDDQAAQEQMSRSDAGRNGRLMTGSASGNGVRANFDQNYAGGIASTMPSGMNPPTAFSMPNGQNLHSYSQNYDFAGSGTGIQAQPPTATPQTLPNGRNAMHLFANSSGQQPLEWPQVFQPTTANRFTNPYNTNISDAQVGNKPEPTANDIYIKPDPNSNSNSSNNFSSVFVPGTGLDFPSLNFQHDPLQQISSRLLFLCFPPNGQLSSRNLELKKYLSADNIKHFLEHFSSFQGHFPLLHMPTFRILDAHDGLLLGMICIGAVYSDRITPPQVRELMDLAKVVIEGNSKLYAKFTREPGSEDGYSNEGYIANESEVEEITAIFMMHVLSTWNGNPFQREKARRQFPLIIALAKKAGLTHPVPSLSALHQPNVENVNASNFNWTAWVQQEKRSRLMFCIFLVDAAMVIYFNIAPLLEMLEVRLPLPADDAAWDAADSTACADALGLNGPVIARSWNLEGSRRPKQPEMHSALRALLHNHYDLQPGTTNLYSKFILIHALHIQLWNAQRQLTQEPNLLSNNGSPFSSSGTSTPVGQNGWVMRTLDATGSGASSANTSGRVTPVEATFQSAQSHQLLKATNNAFDKWKKAWDEDMANQYPPKSQSLRRFGFCRDGVHFYWLAKYLMQKNRALDLNMAPDHRFSQVMHLLTSVKSWVVSDSATRGEELGSVSEINKDYGVTDLTLNMAQLFKPINKQHDSPVVGVQTNGVAA